MDYDQWVRFYSQFFCPDCGGFHHSPPQPIWGGPPPYGGYGGQQSNNNNYPPQRPPPQRPPPNPRPPPPPISAPPLPPPGPSRNPPLNPSATFLNPSLNASLPGTTTHPKSPLYPRTLTTAPPPTTSTTPEQQNARAFILSAVHLVHWGDFGEDMFALHAARKVDEDLAGHVRYFLYVVLPHLRAGGEAPPGDYCKMRALLDRCAEVGGVWGGALVWSDGFGKKGGRARERGWWRKEREGFREGPGLQPGML